MDNAQTEFDNWLDEVCSNPGTRFVLRARLIEDKSRDAVDALYDAELLLEAARRRVEILQHRHRAPQRD